MEAKDISACLANGGITLWDRTAEGGDISWKEHPKFKGVFLKHLITGADTEGKLSCHLVRVDPHCLLDEHEHPEQWELHEVIRGKGVFLMNFRETAYRVGSMAVIPPGTRHKVLTGKDGLVLLAKFFPTLL